MMGLDFFRRSVELAEQLCLPEQRVSHTIQTNGTLIDDEWGRSSPSTASSRRPVDRRPTRDA